MKSTVKILAALMLMGSFVTSAFAQKHMTRTGHLWFYSHTPVEDIEAHNNQAMSVLNADNGEMVFAVLMKGFQFEKALMQEHFNEKYVESDKFPKASFKGKITNVDEVDFAKDGTYAAKAEGELTIHGVTQEVEAEGEVKVENGNIVIASVFQLKPEDYDIKIPGIVRDNIAKIIDIHVDITYESQAQAN